MTPFLPDQYGSERFEQARATIMTALERHDSLVVVTGENRTGKTTLCQSVVEGAEGGASSVIASPFLTFHELLKQVAADLSPVTDLDAAEEELALAATEDELVALLERSLDAHSPQRPVVVVDEAHLINRLVLGKLPRLLDLSTEARGMTMVLVGQPALETTLRRPELKSLGLRAGARCRLGTPSKPAVAVEPPVRSLRVAISPRGRRIALRLGALAVVVFTVGWMSIGLVRRVSEASSQPEPPSPISSTPAVGAVATAPSAPRAPLAESIPVADVDAKLEALHRSAERQAIFLASRGEVNELLALRAETERTYVQIGAPRPDFLAALLGELDVLLERARAAQRFSSRP